MTKKRKNSAAVTLGRKGGQGRAKNLTKEQLSQIGKKGAAKRWKGETK
jgi:general stress protein YciG